MVKQRKPVKKILGIIDNRTPHRKFEDYAEKYLKKKYTGFSIKPQHHSHTTSTYTDFYGQNKYDSKDRFTAEVKHVNKLTKTHIDQAAFVYPRFPKEKLAIISKSTEVSENLKEYANKRKVKIVRLREDFH
jgi:hypothetical protein